MSAGFPQGSAEGGGGREEERTCLWALPRELLLLILDLLSTPTIFRDMIALLIPLLTQCLRLSIVAHNRQYFVLKNTGTLILNRIHSSGWSKTFNKLLQLPRLRGLSFEEAEDEGEEHLAGLLAMAPGLSWLDLQAASLPIGSYSSYYPNLRGCRNLRFVAVNNLQAWRVSLLQFLPPQLTTLVLSLTNPGPGAEIFSPLPTLTVIAQSCPQLRELRLVCPQSARLIVATELLPIQEMRTLEALTISGVSLWLPALPGATKFHTARLLLAPLIPQSRNTPWKALRICQFDFFYCLSLPLPVADLRAIRALGVPSQPLAHGSKRLLQLTEEEQREFLRFHFDESANPPSLCQCRHLYCGHTSFLFILSLHPHLAEEVIGEHFLPAVEAKAKLTGASPGAVAASLLANFHHPTYNEETVAMYIRTRAYPLDVNGGVPSEQRMAIFFNLSDSARQELVTRAKATGVQLQLSECSVSDVVSSKVLGAAQVDPKFLIRRFARIVEVADRDQLEDLIAQCPLPFEERITIGKEWAESLLGPPARTALLAPLALLFSDAGLDELIGEAITSVSLSANMLEALLKRRKARGLSFAGLRSATGNTWLHLQIQQLSPLPLYDKELYLVANANGDTPLHEYCRGWKTLLGLLRHFSNLSEELLQYFQEHHLWDKRNNAGKRPLDLGELPDTDAERASSALLPMAAIQVLQTYLPHHSS